MSNSAIAILAAQPLKDWIKENEPDLHLQLCAAPPSIAAALRILSDACGFEIGLGDSIEETTPRVIEALTAKRARGAA